jgi:Tfp pilus assembly protein PilN
VHPFRNIDFQRLGGLSCTLGIDLTDDRAHIVELERRGNPFNRFNPAFVVKKSFTVTFDSSAGDAEKGERIRSSIIAHKVRTKFAVSSVQSLGVKTVAVTVPVEVSSIEEWVNEHFEKLIKLPLVLDQVSYQYEILRRSTDGSIAEISFIRRSDLNQHKEIYRRAGLELLTLGAGTRDAINGFLVSPEANRQGETRFVYVGDKSSSLSRIEDGRRKETFQINPGGLSELERDFAPGDEKAKGSSGQVLLTGELTENEGTSAYRVFRPFGADTRYVLAVGLAIKGFLPELSTMNFLTPKEREETGSKLYRAFFRRTALVFGSLLIVLLGSQMLMTSIVQSKIDALTVALSSSGDKYIEIRNLEQEVKNLESKLGGSESSPLRTNVAKALHDVAAATPDSVWLYKLSLDLRDSQNRKLSLSGYARSNEGITVFLKRLRERGGCSSVTLLSSGSAPQSQPGIPVGIHGSSFVVFDIRGVIRG